MRRGRRARVGLLLAVVLVALPAAPAPAAIDLTQFSGPQSVIVAAEAANRWQQGGYEVWVLRGNCRIIQGFTARAATRPCCGSITPTTCARQRSKAIVYLEGDVMMEMVRGGKSVKLTDKTWLGRFFTTGPVEVHAGAVAGRPDVLPAVYQRGMEPPQSAAGADVVRRAGVEQAQYSPTPSTSALLDLLHLLDLADSARTEQAAAGLATSRQPPPVVGTPLPPGTRRVASSPAATSPSRPSGSPSPRTTSGWQSSSRA